MKTLLRTTPLYIKLLAQNGISTMRDFFNYFPRAYEDRANIKPLNQLIFNEKGITATKGKILSKKVFRRGGKMIYDISFEDELGIQGTISIFNSGYLASKLQEGSRYIIVGKPAFKYGKIIFSHPDIVPSSDSGELQENYNSGRIFPVYSEMNGIKPWRFAKKIRELRSQIPNYFSEYLPEEFLKEFQDSGYWGLFFVPPEAEILSKIPQYPLSWKRIAQITGNPQGLFWSSAQDSAFFSDE